MKKILLHILFLFCGITVTAQGYSLKVKVKGIPKDSLCLLAHYYADKQYVKDSAIASANGTLAFEGHEKLPGGIYVVFLPISMKKSFEFIIDKEQNISFETDTADLINRMKITGSPDNVLFYRYQSFVTKKSKEIEPWTRIIQKTKNQDSIEMLRKKIAPVDKEVKEYKIKYMKEHANTFLAKIFSASQEPEVPETPILPNGRKDSLFAYRYFKAHYWDGVDFSADNLVRTPVIYNKLKYYLDKLTMQTADSINKAADFLMVKVKPGTEMYKYISFYFTYTYENSKVMGMDAVFVHMVENYYMNGRATWVDSANLKKMVERAMILKPILIGKKAPPLTLQDVNGKLISYYDIHSKYLLLYFWDPTCSHCKKETPKMKKFYDTFKSKGIEVYAVNIQSDIEDWKKNIQELGIEGWVNVIDPYNRVNFKNMFDVYSTPVLYLVDENKKIIAKRVDAEQLDGYVAWLLKQNSKQ